jgi:hypothetical protein
MGRWMCECKSCQENYGITPSAPDLEGMVCGLCTDLNTYKANLGYELRDQLRTFAAKVDARARTTREQLAEAMNALPYIDPHDDEAWMVDTVWDKLKRLAGEE